MTSSFKDGQDPGLTQSSPALTPEEMRRTELLGSVPPEILEVIGAGNALILEEHAGYIEGINQVLEAGNPFEPEGQSNADLSFMGSAKSKIEGYSKPHHAKRPELKKHLPILRMVLPAEAGRLIVATQAADARLQEASGVEMNIADTVEVLREVAKQLPTKATVKTVKNIYWFIADHPQSGWCQIHLGRGARLIADPEAFREEGQELQNEVEAVREVGHKNYERLLGQLTDSQTHIAIELLSTLSRLGDELINQDEIPELGQGEQGPAAVIRDMYSVDDYLRSKARLASDVIMRNAPDQIDEGLAQAIARFEENGEAEAEETVETETTLRSGNMRRFDEYRTRVLHAKDVLKGGRRLLDAKKDTALRAWADELHKLGKEAGLDYAEVGLMIAAAKSEALAFEFVHAWGLAQDIKENGIRTQMVHEVHSQHPGVFEELVGFDLGSAVSRIGDVVRSHTQMGELLSDRHKRFEKLFVDYGLLDAI